MTCLIVQILTGARRGRRESFTQTPVSFGRSANCDLVIDVPQASRQHGLLVFENDQWVVVNESPNGTTANGKKVGSKPRPLGHGDVIGVAREPMFAVGFEESAEASPITADTANAAPSDPQADHMKRRTRLWMGIGVYLGLMLVGMAILSQVMGKDENKGAGIPELLSDTQITKALTAPLVLQPNQGRAEKSLDRARSLYNQRQRSDKTLYACYMAFKQYLAYAEKSSLASTDQLQFDQTEKEVVDLVINQYRDAYANLSVGKWNVAESSLRYMVVEFELPKAIKDHINQILRVAADKPDK